MRYIWIFWTISALLLLSSCSATRATSIIRDYDKMEKSEVVKELRRYDIGDFDIVIDQKDGVVTATAIIGDRIAVKEVKQSKSWIRWLIFISVVLAVLYIAFRFVKRLSPL